jgi:CheY-like chemotaxis protein
MWNITPNGRRAWEDQDASIPSDYRKFLWMIDVQGDIRAIQELLRSHPEQLVRDWLRELEQLGFLVMSLRTPEADRTIPLKVSELAKAAGEKAAAMMASGGAYLSLDREARKKPTKPREKTVILIVEDDPDQLALADLRVTMAGYQVRSAETIQQLVRSLLEHGAPDLLLLDVMLPDGDGFDVLAKLRRHRDFASLPIVMLTAKQDAADIARGLAYGADGYVTKPYSKNVLAGVISGVLE